MTTEEMRAVLDPKKYTGRCAEQTEQLVKKIRPLLGETTSETVIIEV